MEPLPNNNILYLSYDGMTDPLGQSQVLPYLEGLSKKGMRFTLVSFEKPTRLSVGKAQIQAICKRAHIDWRPLPYTKHPPVFSTLKDIIRLRKVVRRLHQEKAFKIIHCRSYITSLIGLEMKRKYGVKFIFDMRGFWADERVEGGIWNMNNPLFRLIYWFFKRKERAFFEEADHIISLTAAGQKEIHSWPLAKQPLPLTVIPCCADLSFFSYEAVSPEKVAEYRRKINLPSCSLVLSYLGSIGTWYMLPEMLAFFKVIRKHIPDAHFLFITGESPVLIEREAHRQNIPLESLTVRRASRQEVPYYLSMSQISIFFIKPVFSKTASSPTKQGEIMGMGIPIICNDHIGDTGPIIRSTGAGLAVPSFDVATYEEVAAKLEELKQIPKAQIREGAFTYYSLNKGIASYAEVYQKLLS